MEEKINEWNLIYKPKSDNDRITYKKDDKALSVMRANSWLVILEVIKGKGFTQEALFKDIYFNDRDSALNKAIEYMKSN